MYYFSDKFLTGLKSKSENFQNEFFYVVDRLCQDSGDDQFIQAMIEQELSWQSYQLFGTDMGRRAAVPYRERMGAKDMRNSA